jgi:hypothetical protein
MPTSHIGDRYWFENKYSATVPDAPQSIVPIAEAILLFEFGIIISPTRKSC